ncbi:MAG: helix-turn-helix transcriptional regulator [Spirochaetota bacterium]|jgi:transcriptional regulator with XRE-family HTH domain|nr:helix-turn-helix transcriptional regulator [Spirochaetota bacterium]
MTNIRELLSANIRAFRHDLGLTQSKLAELADTSTCYIQQIEGMKRFPSPEMLEQIASALKKDTPDLFSIPSPHAEWKERVLSKVNDVIQKEILELKGRSRKPKGKI